MHKHLIQRLHIKNLLSYGNEGVAIDLLPLNVLIGPNAAGKSNLIEVLSLLQATPKDLVAAIREGGGIEEWLWKGDDNDATTAEIDVTVDYPQGLMPLRYRLHFTQLGQRLEVVDEAIENEHSQTEEEEEDATFFYRYQQGNPIINACNGTESLVGNGHNRTQRLIKRETLLPDQSILSQRKDPDQYPELTYLSNQFAAIHLYREWTLGYDAKLRKPQKTDLSGNFLEESGRNLALVLNALEHKTGTKQQFIAYLQEFYPRIKDVTTLIDGGTVQIFIHEEGFREPIPATRLSDGTLRYLFLLALLSHPSPPPLICIEEPEVGLHPDILLDVAELLTQLSQRSQLIVTTHSHTLVSALSDNPESIIVCERDEQGTTLQRLQSEKLEEWLEDYTLGELWRMGEIGGNRWGYSSVEAY